MRLNTHRIRFFVATVALSLFAGKAYSQDLHRTDAEKKWIPADTVENFEQIHKPPPRSLLRQLIEREIRKFEDREGCSGGKLNSFDNPSYAIFDGLVAAGMLKGKYLSGWHVDAEITTCEESYTQRAVVFKKMDGEVFARLTSPGRKHSWESLIADFIKTIYTGAHVIGRSPNANCNKSEGARFRIIDAQVTEEKNLGPKIFGVYMSGKWTEEWTVENCLLIGTIPVQLTADGKGGAYFTVNNRHIKVIGPAN